MDWFKDLYDDFRMRTGFGSIPAEVTREHVDFLIQELGLSEGSKVLDLFCGTGRHTIELARRGILSVGVEYNPDYLALAAERARRASVSPSFIQGDVRDVDFGSDYDAAIIMWASFGYFEDADDRRLLRRVHTALNPGGRLLMELKNRDHILRHFRPSSERTVDGITVREEREFDLLNSRLNATITRFEADRMVVKKVSWRMYSLHEIRGILEGVGFTYVTGYAGMSRGPLTLDTHLMRLILKR